MIEKSKFMKNWVLLSASMLLFSTGMCQDCNYFIDTSRAKIIEYIPIDTTLVNDSNCIFLLEFHNGRFNTYKFENYSDSILVTKSNNSNYQQIKIKGNFQEFKIESNKIYFISEVITRYKYNMVIIKHSDSVCQIIPHGSTIEEVLKCIKEYDPSLFSLVYSILELKNRIDDLATH